MRLASFTCQHSFLLILGKGLWSVINYKNVVIVLFSRIHTYIWTSIFLTWYQCAINSVYYFTPGLHRWLSGKKSACQAGDTGSTPRLEKSSGGRNGNPLQYSGVGDPMKEEPGGLESMRSDMSQTQLSN